RPEQRPARTLVAPAEDADQRRDEDRSDNVEAEGREVLAGADRKRERDQGDEHDRRDDPPGALAQLARPVQAVAPEDEDEHERQEREPARLPVPEQVPEDWL